MALHEVENWDDDLELDGPILNNSVSAAQTSRSFSSRLSLRSESNAGEDEWNVGLTSNDEQSTSKAISSAKLAGIPIPANVPSSALLGGSIKRLGKKKSRQNIKDDWSEDLELPDSNLAGLKFNTVRAGATTPGDDRDDFDDWAEGSLGTRIGGTRRESKKRGSSISAMSPSMGSCITLESEEDGLEGLVIPSGPMNLQAALKKRQETDTQEQIEIIEPQTRHVDHMALNEAKPMEDTFEDIDFGTGDVFDPKRRTLNRNVKQNWRPTKEHSSTLPRVQTTITFTDKPVTRIPRPVAASKPSRLEPVLETAVTHISRPRRPEPTTTGAQLLRSKRSMPVLRNQPSPLAKPQVTSFLPSGVSHSNLHHVPSRPLAYHTRHESDPSRPHSPPLRSQSRGSNSYAPDTPTRQRRDVAPASLAREAAAKRTVTKPVRRRNFGDGTELDTFDDLPTSVAKESQYIKQPSTRAPPKTLRPQASQSRLGTRDKMITPLPMTTPRSPTKADNLPRFARDTAASRIAREQKLGENKPRSDRALMQRINWQAQVASRSPHTSPTAHRNQRKGPQLVKSLGKENIKQFEDDAATKGMRWDPVQCRWIGNENALLPFEAVASPSPSRSPPRPALITNISGAQGVQVVGGMVFDPQRMCWLKIGATPSNPKSPSLEEEDDPFSGIEDLKDTPAGVDANTIAATRDGNIGSEWMVGEEFDLGPEFIRRQREEETMWRSRIGGWFGSDREEGENYKWALRDDIAALVGI